MFATTHMHKQGKKEEEKHTVEHKKSLQNRAMTLQEEEKSVIQAGAYIVIKSHVKKKKNANTLTHTHHLLSLALSQHFL